MKIEIGIGDEESPIDVGVGVGIGVPLPGGENLPPVDPEIPDLEIELPIPDTGTGDLPGLPGEEGTLPTAPLPTLPFFGGLLEQSQWDQNGLSGTNGASRFSTTGILDQDAAPTGSFFLSLSESAETGGRAELETAEEQEEKEALDLALQAETLFDLFGIESHEEAVAGSDLNISEPLEAGMAPVIEAQTTVPTSFKFSYPDAGAIGALGAINQGAYQEALSQFLSELEGLAQSLRDWLMALGPMPWIVMGLAVCASLQSVIRQQWQLLRRQAAGNGEMLQWFPTLADFEGA